MSTSCQSILVLLILGLALHPTQAQTVWHIDDDCEAPGKGTESDPFCKIQDGVDASSDGDTVLVRGGTYTGNGNRDISLFGKMITLKSTDGPDSTLLDIEGNPQSIHRGFFLIHGETIDTIIEGLTIINGYLIGDTGGTGPGGGGGGGAFYIRDSSPTIRNCVIRDHISATLSPPFPVDGRGGGIYIDGGSSALIENCIIATNLAERRGGGIMIIAGEQNSVTIINCFIAGNSTGVNYPGGGIHLTGFASIVGATIAFNMAGGPGGGIHNDGGDPLLANCILWGNQAGPLFPGQQIAMNSSSIVAIMFSAVEGGLGGIEGSGSLEWGPGMIDADPLFVHPDNGNFHLLSGSPCIDAGNNLAVPEGADTDLDGGPRFLDDPNTRDTGNPDPDQPKLPIVDMGPYEFDPDDCNNNGVPDEEDLASGESSDIDENGIPDDCQLDCNRNGIPDSYEISEGLAADCDTNGVPDECDPDCNENDQPDACDITDGISTDCNGNGIPDECPGELPGPPITQQPVSQEVEIGEFAFFQVQADGVVLEYQWRKDSVDLSDSERIIGSESATLFILDVQASDAGEYDCVVTELFDLSCSTSDLATLTVTIPCPADMNNDGEVGPVDLAMLLAAWGPCPDPDACPADLNADGVVNPLDLAQLLAAWGACP